MHCRIATTGLLMRVLRHWVTPTVGGSFLTCLGGVSSDARRHAGNGGARRPLLEREGGPLLSAGASRISRPRPLREP
jgi:hypothetical protein